ncbi:MAG: response regulator [Rhodothermales bacterium]
MTDSIANEKLETLRASYLGKLPEKVREIEMALQRVNGSGEDVTNGLREAYGLLHKMIGGAGIYGFTSISTMASTFLDFVRPRKDLQNLPASTLAEIGQLMRALREEVERVVERRQPETESSALRFHPPAHPSLGMHFAGREVFVVDDDPDQTRMLDFVLQQAGFEVATFGALEDLEYALAERTPFAIVSDMMFPENNLAGAEAIARVRSRIDASVPVFFLSARRDIAARLAASRAGATRYFTKPVDVRGLIGAIEKSKRPKSSPVGRVLIIDDDLVPAQFIAAKLTEAGVETDILTSPLLALEAIECSNPDLLLLDYYMPGCTGLELAAVIRQHEAYFDLPIIFLTSEANEEVEMEAVAIGSDDFFRKGMEPDTLVKALKARLSRIKAYASVKKANLWSPEANC